MKPNQAKTLMNKIMMYKIIADLVRLGKTLEEAKIEADEFINKKTKNNIT